MTRAKSYVGLMILTLPVTGWGCEPILPLGQLLGGSSMAGPLLLMNSFLLLAAAVAIKCAAFAAFERRLTWRRAVVVMAIANIVSTVPGLAIAVFTGSFAILLALPLVFLLGMWVGPRLSLVSTNAGKPWVTGRKATAAFVGFFALSLGIYSLAGTALEGRGYREYWALKFLFVSLVAGTGILISSVLEEGVIAQLSRQSHGSSTFYTSVVRANYITLAAVLLVAALVMLPKRLHSPNFIVSWWQSLTAALGLT